MKKFALKVPSTKIVRANFDSKKIRPFSAISMRCNALPTRNFQKFQQKLGHKLCFKKEKSSTFDTSVHSDASQYIFQHWQVWYIAENWSSSCRSRRIVCVFARMHVSMYISIFSHHQKPSAENVFAIGWMGVYSCKHTYSIYSMEYSAECWFWFSANSFWFNKLQLMAHGRLGFCCSVVCLLAKLGKKCGKIALKKKTLRHFQVSTAAGGLITNTSWELSALHWQKNVVVIIWLCF